MERSKKTINMKDALIKAQNLCAQQEKCESEIRTKLVTWKVKPDDFDKIIEQLKVDKYIDEQRYAVSFAKEKFKFNKWGKIKIDFALKQKSIPKEFIANALMEIQEDDYNSILLNELQEKLKSIKETDEYTIKSKLLRYALSKGFENGKVFDMVSKIIENNK